MPVLKAEVYKIELIMKQAKISTEMRKIAVSANNLAKSKESPSATSDPNAQIALEQLPKLKGLEAYTSVLLSDVDINIFKKLGVHLTSEPIYETKKIYH